MKRVIVAVILIFMGYAPPVLAAEWFDLGEYRKLEKSDRQTLELILGAMYETVFYAQESVGTTVICATPIPQPGERLMRLVAKEIAHPTNALNSEYGDADHVAFVFMNALKAEGMCK